MLKANGVASVMAGAGILIASLVFVYQEASPYFSEESCVISSAENSGEAVGAAIQACRDRHGGKESRSVEEVPSFIARKIDGRATFSQGALHARFYNGGSHYTITRIKIGVTDPETAALDSPDTRYYEMSVNIPPLSTHTAMTSVFQEYDEVNWHIEKAWGVDKS